MDRQELLKEVYEKVTKVALAPVNSFATFCKIHKTTSDKQLIEINNNLGRIIKEAENIK